LLSRELPATAYIHRAQGVRSGPFGISRTPTMKSNTRKPASRTKATKKAACKAHEASKPDHTNKEERVAKTASQIVYPGGSR
jgi:hypothetical protein